MLSITTRIGIRTILLVTIIIRTITTVVPYNGKEKTCAFLFQPLTIPALYYCCMLRNTVNGLSTTLLAKGSLLCQKAAGK